MAVPRSITGSTVNPITDGRIKLQMSLNGLSRRLGLSKQYISKAEQGTYTNLNPALLLWTSQVLGITRNQVNDRYWRFQKAQRRQTMETVAPHKLDRIGDNETPGYVLFKHWREGYFPSDFAFSTAFCLHPETVKSYEDGIRRTMPFAIKQVLEECDLIGSNWSDGPKRRPSETLSEGRSVDA